MKYKKILIAITTFTFVFVGAWFLWGSSKPTQAEFLANYQLESMDTQSLVNYLESNPNKPADLQAQISPSTLSLQNDKDSINIDLDNEDFYLSFAPYMEQTHPCFNHVPTGCQGELPKREFEVLVTQDNGTVLFDDTVETAANGFAGIWLPRDIEATITVTYFDQSATTTFTTQDTDGTCLTTLKLV